MNNLLRPIIAMERFSCALRTSVQHLENQALCLDKTWRDDENWRCDENPGLRITVFAMPALPDIPERPLQPERPFPPHRVAAAAISCGILHPDSPMSSSSLVLIRGGV